MIDLPADPPAPKIPALDVLREKSGSSVAQDGATWLSELLYYSAAISAAKRVPSTGYRYSLRVNPSSGNLHPTEFHFATRGLAGWEDGLYHYRPSSHMVELRARGDYVERVLSSTGTREFRNAQIVFVLTTIAWREAWKYRSRAYRYCLHDMGHAWQSLALAARSMGAEAFALGHFADDGLAELLRLTDEWPLLVVPLHGERIPTEPHTTLGTKWLGGVPNVLSREQVPYPLIEGVHASSKLVSPAEPLQVAEPPQIGSGEIKLAGDAASELSFGEVVRKRRSALDFRGGLQTIAFEKLSTLLNAASRPFAADFENDLTGAQESRYIQLYLYVHRVDQLVPGVYRYWADDGSLELVKPGDQRVMAAALSLGQELAGNACVAFSMIADLERAARVHGNRGYRYAHYEAGAMGQRLYVAAEAMGFQSTGIGAFFDDDVNRYLEIDRSQGQVIYHFACGYAVTDARLEA